MSMLECQIFTARYYDGPQFTLPDPIEYWQRVADAGFVWEVLRKPGAERAQEPTLPPCVKFLPPPLAGISGSSEKKDGARRR